MVQALEPVPRVGPGRVPPHNLEAEESLLGAMMLSRDAITAATEVARRRRRLLQARARAHLRRDRLALRPGRAGRPGHRRRRAAPRRPPRPARRPPGAAAPPGADAGVGERGPLREHRQRARAAAAAHRGRRRDLRDGLRRLRRRRARRSTAPSRWSSRSPSGRVDRLDDRRLRRAAGRARPARGALRQPGRDHRCRDRLPRPRQLLLGLQPSNLVVVAARPGAGKTAFALGAAANVAMTARRPVLFFSMEMGTLELTKRLLAAEARVELRKLQTGKIREDEWSRLSHAVGRLAEAPFFIDDNPHCTVMEMRAKARRTKARHGDLGLIVVDYLQLMTPSVAPAHGEPPGRGGRDLARVEDPRPRARLPGDGALAAQPPARVPPRQAPDARRPARVGLPHRRHARHARRRERGSHARRAAPHRRARRSGLDARRAPEARSGDDDPRVPEWREGGVRAPARVGSHGQRRAPTIRSSRSTAGRDSTSSRRGLASRRRAGSRPPRSQEAGETTSSSCSGTSSATDAIFRHTRCSTRRSIRRTSMRSRLPPRSRFGIAARVKQERTWTQVYLPAPYHLTHGKRNPIGEWLETLGLWGKRSWEKHVPRELLSLSERQIALFLRHLWATDGSVIDRSGAPRVYYATSSHAARRRRPGSSPASRHPCAASECRSQERSAWLHRRHLRPR